MPTVSVIIPTSNRPALLQQAIESVFAQSYQDWEIIVVDDRPSEDTCKVVSKYSPRAIYVQGEGAGPSRARNFGLKCSSGELISFLDDDDLLLPQNLELLSTLLEENPALGSAYGWYAWIDPTGAITARPGPAITKVPPIILSSGHLVKPCGFKAQGNILAPLLLEESLLIGNALIRRQWIDKCEGFDPSIDYQEHWDFYLRLAEAGCEFYCCEQMVSLHRLHQCKEKGTYANRGQNLPNMLAGRIKVLDRIFKKENLPADLVAVRDQAYYNAYEEYLGHYQRRNQHPLNWITPLTGALHFATGNPGNYYKLGKNLSTGLLKINQQEQKQVIRELKRHLPNTLEARKMWRSAMSRVQFGNAIKENYLGAPRSHILKHLTLAWANAPKLVKSRKWWGLTFEQFATPNLKDLFTFLSLPLPGLIDKVQSGAEVLFLSPHFDDVVLSCGGLLTISPAEHTRLVTVFTDSPNQDLSPLATAFHKQWGTEHSPYLQRQAEDKAVAAKLGIRSQWLGFHEVIYRDKSLTGIEQLYKPTLAPADESCYQDVCSSIEDIVRKSPGCIIFAPLGIGHHRDHIIVHEAARKVEQNTNLNAHFFYYEDFPYSNTRASIKHRLNELGASQRLTGVDITTTLSQRINLAMMYHSQLDALFGGEEQATQSLKSYARRVGIRGHARERYWKLTHRSEIKSTYRES